MARTLIKRPVLLIAACILVSAITGMMLGRVSISGAAPGADPRPVVEPVTPCRILETRNAPGTNGPTGAPAAPLTGGQTLTLQVAGATGQGGCAIAGGLVGAVLNITAVNASADTFLTVFPCDATRPNASTLNPFPGRISFNSASVRLSATGTVCIYNNGGTVDVIADVTGILYNHNHDDRYFTETEINARSIWVTVGSNGAAAPNVIRGGVGVTAVSRVNAGLYRVIFNRNVNTCGWLATLQDKAGGAANPGEISAELESDTTLNALFIRTYNSAGAETELGTTEAFTLQVLCP